VSRAQWSVFSFGSGLSPRFGLVGRGGGDLRWRDAFFVLGPTFSTPPDHPGLALGRARATLFLMKRPTQVEALAAYRLRLTYPDGVDGVIDLAGDIGRGVFSPLADEAFFRTVHIGEFGQIAWSDDIEICPDAAYQEIVQAAATEPAHA